MKRCLITVNVHEGCYFCVCLCRLIYLMCLKLSSFVTYAWFESCTPLVNGRGNCVLLHCTLAQCTVNGPVCVWVCLCGSVTMITRNCMHHPHQTGFVGKGSDHLQLIKFWPSCAHGKGSAAGRNFLTPHYYSQHAVFASLPSAFFIQCCNVYLHYRKTITSVSGKKQVSK